MDSKEKKLIFMLIALKNSKDKNEPK